MSVSENIQYLRKQRGFTQEEFADELGVSRQAVSKWETGEAYPDTDKIIAICDYFGVTADELLRGSVVGAGRNVQENATGQIRRFSLFIAGGILLVAIGVALCVLFKGIQAYFNSKTYEVCAVALLLGFTAAAAFLFIYAGIKQENYKKAHPDALADRSSAERFMKRFPAVIASLATGVILLVVALVLVHTLFEAGTPSGELARSAATAAFLLGAGVCAAGLALTGIRHEFYGRQAKTEEERRSGEPRKKFAKMKDGICGAIMLTATAVYLLIGFVWHLWHPGWIVFVVGGILCAVLSALFDGFKKD